MIYGKIENGVLVYAPKTLIVGDKKVINPTAEIYKEQGYKPVENTLYPIDGKHYKQSYEESDNKITVVWQDNEKEYWQNVDLNEAVNAAIREKYSESQEFAILRQKDEKPKEYAEYYAYCEQCKKYIKEKKAEGVE